MSLADELLKLEDLRDRGTLSASEFQDAKALLLGGEANPALPQFNESLEQLRREAEIARIDREWEIERKDYLVRGKYGSTHVPTVGVGIGAALVGGGFGAVWTIFAGVLTSQIPFPLVGILFPLFGVIFTLFAIGWGIVCINRALHYTKAHAAYQIRRSAVAV